MDFKGQVPSPPASTLVQLTENGQTSDNGQTTGLMENPADKNGQTRTSVDNYLMAMAILYWEKGDAPIVLRIARELRTKLRAGQELVQLQRQCCQWN